MRKEKQTKWDERRASCNGRRADMNKTDKGKVSWKELNHHFSVFCETIKTSNHVNALTIYL